MNLAEIIHSAVAHDLVEAPTRSSGATQAWEHRTLNIHRGVVLLERSGPTDVESLLQEVRTTVRNQYNLRWAWLRGFAFGAVLATDGIPDNFERLAHAIDRYNRSAGVFQWLVHVVAKDPRMAFGVHMWAEGYLSPTYRRLVEALRNQLGDCLTFVDDKGPLFEFANKIGKLPGPEFTPDR